jgi:exodeoxyribonuclease VII small subunit
MTERTFEENLQKLEELVSRLEQGDLPLEEAIGLFREGMEVARTCAGKLAVVEKEVKKLVAEGAKLKLESFELDET